MQILGLWFGRRRTGVTRHAALCRQTIFQCCGCSIEGLLEANVLAKTRAPRKTHGQCEWRRKQLVMIDSFPFHRIKQNSQCTGIHAVFMGEPCFQVHASRGTRTNRRKRNGSSLELQAPAHWCEEWLAEKLTAPQKHYGKSSRFRTHSAALTPASIRTVLGLHVRSTGEMTQTQSMTNELFFLFLEPRGVLNAVATRCPCG